LKPYSLKTSSSLVPPKKMIAQARAIHAERAETMGFVAGYSDIVRIVVLRKGGDARKGRMMETGHESGNPLLLQLGRADMLSSHLLG